MQQPRAEPALQPGHRLADRRAGEAEALARQGEAAGLDGLDEGLHPGEVVVGDHAAPFIPEYREIIAQIGTMKLDYRRPFPSEELAA